MTTRAALLDGLTICGAVVSCVAAATATLNLRTIPRLDLAERSDVTERITVCIPARNEVDRLPALLSDLAAQRRCPGLEVIVVDDGSTDGTADAARSIIGTDPRFRIVSNHADPPPGWTGKAAACAELAALASDPDVIVFVDADVRLSPDAVAAAASALRLHRAALVCPWPAQEAHSPVERLVQPLLAWSWMSTLPVALANASTIPSMSVSCGQFMMFDAAAYVAVGGHASVAASLAEDLDIARALRRRGARTVLVSGAGAVRCRMYESGTDLRDGYTRWLWQAFGGPAGSAAVLGIAAVGYLLPPVAALVGRGSTRRWGLIGFAAAVLSRVQARRLDLPDAGPVALLAAGVTHPFSVAAFAALVLDSHRRARLGRLGWKNRALPAHRP